MKSLHDDFGVEIEGIDLRDAATHYTWIRRAFEEHSVLLFRDQCLDDEAHLPLGRLFGVIEIRERNPQEHEARMSMVSNRREGGHVLSEESPRLLHLKANQLWHTDSTFLPAPALANILAARKLPTSGGETEFVSTRAAWRDLPGSTRMRLRRLVLRHRYAHSRMAISPAAAALDVVTMWPETAWRAVWPNPVNGAEALYIASHAFGVVGMGEREGRELIQELIAFTTRPARIYSHRWSPGDVIIWDERATMHRGRPWPYGEERTLASICITAGEADGLGWVRPAPAG